MAPTGKMLMQIPVKFSSMVNETRHIKFCVAKIIEDNETWLRNIFICCKN
jgi:hypothetical protein